MHSHINTRARMHSHFNTLHACNHISTHVRSSIHISTHVPACIHTVYAHICAKSYKRIYRHKRIPLPIYRSLHITMAGHRYTSPSLWQYIGTPNHHYGSTSVHLTITMAVHENTSPHLGIAAIHQYTSPLPPPSPVPGGGRAPRATPPAPWRVRPSATQTRWPRSCWQRDPAPEAADG